MKTGSKPERCFDSLESSSSADFAATSMDLGANRLLAHPTHLLNMPENK